MSSQNMSINASQVPVTSTATKEGVSSLTVVCPMNMIKFPWSDRILRMIDCPEVFYKPDQEGSENDATSTDIDRTLRAAVLEAYGEMGSASVVPDISIWSQVGLPLLLDESTKVAEKEFLSKLYLLTSVMEGKSNNSGTAGVTRVSSTVHIAVSIPVPIFKHEPKDVTINLGALGRAITAEESQRLEMAELLAKPKDREAIRDARWSRALHLPDS